MAESHREEIAKLEALYAGNPGGRVFVHLAEAYRKAGEHERARRILDEGLARHPDSASGYVVLGRVLADMQVTGEAEAAFRRVLELDGGNLIALRWLGDLARQSGRNAEAAVHYRELLIRNPSNEEVRDLVEIVEREAAGEGDAAVVADTSPFGERPADAFAGLDTDAARDEAALAGSAGGAEEAALTPPAAVSGAEQPDITPWAAAPGQTGDSEEPPVEFGLVELETDVGNERTEAASDEVGEAPGVGDERAQTAFDGVAEAPGVGDERAQAASDGVAEAPGVGDERAQSAYDGVAEGVGVADEYVVASVEDSDRGVLELDELRRDDEAEPLEIHLLDPAYEPAGEEEGGALAGELDLSDLRSAGSLQDEEDYADEIFVADLSAAAVEEPAPDELPGAIDVMESGAALTLLPENDLGQGADAADTAARPPAEAASIESGVEPPFTHAADDEAGDSIEDGPAEAQAEELSGVGLAELAGAAEPAAEASAVAEVRRRPDSGLVTETMAVLYRSQGFHDRAADVYRSLLRGRPNDERLAAKLREAEEAAGATARPSADDDAGEVWLRGVGAAWTEPADAVTEDATPYAWTTEPEDRDEGEPIGSYLHDLVSWKAGSGAWMQTGTDEEKQPEGDIAVPEWLNGPDATPAWTPDSEPPGYPPTPAAEADWAPAQPVAPDPWETTPAPAEAAPEHAAPADAWAVPSEVADASPAAESEEGAGWTPMELDRDVPAAASSPGGAASPPAQSTPAEDESSDDDDDLEMFRSWLQSLKK